VQLDRAVPPLCQKQYLAVGIAQRVGQQVVERLPDAHAVGENRGAVAAVDDHAPVARAVRSGLQQLDGRYRVGIQRKPPLVGAREQQQVVGQMAEAIGLLDRGADRPLQRGAGRAFAAKQLELRAQHRKRAAKLVARVGDKGPLARDRGVDALQHLVQRAAETAELVVAAGARQTLAEVVRRDLGCATAHSLDWRKRRAGQQVARQRGEQEGGRPADQQDAGEVVKRPCPVLKRLAHDDDQPLVLGSHRFADEPHTVVSQPDLTHNPLASSCLGERAAPQQRPCGQPRRTVSDLARRVHELRQGWDMRRGIFPARLGQRGV
jgi:hypothetical protein